MLVLASIATAFADADVSAAELSPNIILILSDDVGAETIGVYGGESYQTPNIDQLANDGIRFDYGHAQPLCTPSRVKIMTGQHNFRNYRQFAHLDPAETTFAHILKAAGYRTTIAGKWQLYINRFEETRGALPADAGFDEYLLWQLKTEKKSSRFWSPLLDHNGELRQHDATAFGPELFNDYVLNYIEEHKSEPFFIYYPMVLAHDPWVTTPDMRDESASDQQKFAAMMAYMDKMVGNVRRKVEEQGLADRTLIFFIGDNGTGVDIVSRQNGFDVRGAKGATIEAGSRVPFLAWGPSVVERGLESNSLVNLNDIVPTLADIANVALPQDYPGDGVSLVPVLSGDGELSRENIFIHYEPRWPAAKPARYAFDRRWKLYEGGDFFDMLSDPLEKNPLAVAELDQTVSLAYQALQSRIDSMPGELRSKRRWLPPIAYYIVGAGILALVGMVWFVLWLVRKLRR
ncbi:MAG: sulfatase-like hydrolase/transferase [Halioglobus sp.]